MWKKLYTTAERSGNAADVFNDSEWLLSFAAKGTRRYFFENLGSEAEAFGWVQDFVTAVKTPLVFFYLLATGPFLYRYDALPIEIRYNPQENGRCEIQKVVSENGKLMVVDTNHDDLYFPNLDLARVVLSQKGIVLETKDGLEGKLQQKE